MCRRFVVGRKPSSKRQTLSVSLVLSFGLLPLTALNNSAFADDTVKVKLQAAIVVGAKPLGNDINWSIANRANETVAKFLPVKDLAAIKCCCQIEIGRTDIGHRHRQGTYHRGNAEARMTNDERITKPERRFVI